MAGVAVLSLSRSVVVDISVLARLGALLKQRALYRAFREGVACGFEPQ
jgi:hypothetical protein